MCVLRFRPAMPLEVLQRFTWNGTPRELATCFAYQESSQGAGGDLLPSIRLAWSAHKRNWCRRKCAGRRKKF